MSSAVTLELTLVTGERRSLTLPSHTGSIGAAVDRLHDWIETDDGSWVQKRFVVEVRPGSHREDRSGRETTASELAGLDEAVNQMLRHKGEGSQRNDH